MSVAEPIVMPEDELPALLRPPAMARKLGISRSQLDKWSYLPGFPVIRQPHMVLFPWREVEEFCVRMAKEGLLPPESPRKRNRRQ